MDKDDYNKMVELINSGLSTDEVLDKIVDYRRQKESSRGADTSLEEMIDDFLDAARESEEHFETVEKIYNELKEKVYDNIYRSYNYVKHNYSNKFKDFDNKEINQIISDLSWNKEYRSAILACAINYSDLDDIVIYEDVSDIPYIGFRLGENRQKNRIVVKGDAGSYCGDAMSGGEIHVNGDVGFGCGSGMSGGEIHVKGDVVGDSCGFEMSGGEIYVGGDVVGSCGFYMSCGKIEVNGNIGDFCGSFMRSGVISVKGNVGDSCGFKMSGGEIHVKGDVSYHCGYSMCGGLIFTKNKTYEASLPRKIIGMFRNG